MIITGHPVSYACVIEVFGSHFFLLFPLCYTYMYFFRALEQLKVVPREAEKKMKIREKTAHLETFFLSLPMPNWEWNFLGVGKCNYLICIHLLDKTGNEYFASPGEAIVLSFRLKNRENIESAV